RNQPVTGMTAAMVSMKTVSDHWAVVSLMVKSAISVGTALTRVVSLRITTKVAATSSLMTSGVRPGVAVAPASGRANWAMAPASGGRVGPQGAVTTGGTGWWHGPAVADQVGRTRGWRGARHLFHDPADTISTTRRGKTQR